MGLRSLPVEGTTIGAGDSSKAKCNVSQTLTRELSREFIDIMFRSALQYSLQNIADMLKVSDTIIAL